MELRTILLLPLCHHIMVNEWAHRGLQHPAKLPPVASRLLLLFLLFVITHLLNKRVAIAPARGNQVLDGLTVRELALPPQLKIALGSH